jgi:hypothetical protein
MFGSFGMLLISTIDGGIIEGFLENVLLIKLDLSGV